jgi:hypothetical protein
VSFSRRWEPSSEFGIFIKGSGSLGVISLSSAPPPRDLFLGTIQAAMPKAKRKTGLIDDGAQIVWFTILAWWLLFALYGLIKLLEL